jgi:acyl-CoA synthetase (AMP-forming)/AMP-acid ligase II
LQCSEVAVVGVEGEHFGERLKAYIVAANDAAASEEELSSWCAGDSLDSKLLARSSS